MRDQSFNPPNNKVYGAIFSDFTEDYQKVTKEVL